MPEHKMCGAQIFMEDGKAHLRLAPPKKSETREQSPSFPLFNKLPLAVRTRIWEFAMRRGRRFVLRSWRTGIYTLPPGIAYACRESRAVALKHGRVYFGELGDGIWFDKETDCVVWGYIFPFQLGELSKDLENLVVPDEIIGKYTEEMMDILVQVEGCLNLKNIYMEVGDEKIHFLHKRWTKKVGPALFGENNAIVLPNLETRGEEWDRIEEVKSMLPGSVEDYWDKHKNAESRSFASYWPGFRQQIQAAWSIARAKLNPDVFPDKFEDYRNGVLTCADSDTPLIKYDMANNCPNIIPTCALTRLPDRHWIDGKLTENHNILSPWTVRPEGWDSDVSGETVDTEYSEESEDSE